MNKQFAIHDSVDAPPIHGGKRDNAGRKPLNPQGAMGDTLRVRLSDEQKNKVNLLGGAEWVRQMIDAAKLPGVQQ